MPKVVVLLGSNLLLLVHLFVLVRIRNRSKGSRQNTFPRIKPIIPRC